jgi:hypothetical protein
MNETLTLILTICVTIIACVIADKLICEIKKKRLN